MRSLGFLDYNPPLNGSHFNEWWLILKVNNQDIGRYYRTLYTKFYHNCRTIEPASWKDHITIVRNEEPIFKEFWLRYQNLEIEFDYEPIVKTNGQHYWFEVDSPALLDLREELGLSRQPLYNLHLTIGNTGETYENLVGDVIVPNH